MRDVLDLGGVLMLRVDAPNEIVETDLDSAHIIAVRREAIEGGIICPPRIEWFMDVVKPTLLEHFTGNHRRKLKRAYEQLRTLHITLSYHENVTQTQFENFLLVYREMIGQKEHPRLRLSEDSYALLQKYPLSAVFAYDGDRFLGGSLIRDYGEYLSVAYSAYPQFSRKEIETGLGVPIFDLVYQRSVAMHRTRVSYGTDTNIYGFHLSVGLLEYKLSIGCAPTPKELDDEMTYTVFIIKKPETQMIAWHAYTDNGLQMHVASDNALDGMKSQFSHISDASSILSLDALLTKHRNAVRKIAML